MRIFLRLIPLGIIFVLAMLLLIEFSPRPRPRWYLALCRYLGPRYCRDSWNSWEIWFAAAIFNLLVFWESMLLFSLGYHYLFPWIKLTTLSSFGWLALVMERTLRAIGFGIGALFVAPGYLRQQWQALHLLQQKKANDRGEDDWKYEIVKKYITLTLIFLWGIGSAFASISLLREAYELLRQGPTP